MFLLVIYVEYEGVDVEIVFVGYVVFFFVIYFFLSERSIKESKLLFIFIGLI